jgi:pimeloyl-ACP methyl ester carboxylesterase
MTLPRHRLEGEGAPPVVLLNGAGVRLGYWNKVQPLLIAMAATLAYDRGLPPGFRPGETALGAATVGELRGLLAALKLAPPVLLVAHSMGGMYANLYARLFPHEVAGVVLVDSTHPEQERRFAPGSNVSTRGLRKAVAWWDRAFGPGMMTEVVHMEGISDEIRAAPPFPDIPLAVITAAIPPPRWQVPAHLWDIHLDNQRELAAMSRQGRQVMAERSNHFVPKRQPELIAAVVREMLGSVARP